MLIAVMLLFLLLGCLIGYALARMAALAEECRRLEEETMDRWC